MLPLHIGEGAVTEFSGGDVIFILSNVAIVMGYAFIAIRVTPLLPIHQLSRIGAFAFFLLCAATHTDQVLHTLFTQEEMWGEIIGEWHMLAIHIPQAFAVRLFAVGFFIDLRRLRMERGTAEPARPNGNNSH